MIDILRIIFTKQRADSDKNDFTKINYKNITLLCEKLIKKIVLEFVKNFFLMKIH